MQVAISDSHYKCRECSVDILQAITIANDVIANDKHLGKSSGNLEIITVKRFRKPWNDLMPKGSTGEWDKAVMSRLENKVYWLIYYTPDTWQLGGDVGIFIDAVTEETLFVYRGK